MAAIGNATKHGFLVREGDALERLAKVIVFDKTGTLTYGAPEVIAIGSASESHIRKKSIGWRLPRNSYPNTRWARRSWAAVEKQARRLLRRRILK